MRFSLAFHHTRGWIYILVIYVRDQHFGDDIMSLLYLTVFRRKKNGVRCKLLSLLSRLSVPGRTLVLAAVQVPVIVITQHRARCSRTHGGLTGREEGERKERDRWRRERREREREKSGAARRRGARGQLSSAVVRAFGCGGRVTLSLPALTSSRTRGQSKLVGWQYVS